MCGIAGIVAPEAARFTGAIERAIGTLDHRGPDGEGIHAFSHCVLGHRRLAIVDLEGGRQPMLSADASLGVTFNGAIYGFREIRRSLEPEMEFRTRSDTEVLLALYQKYGTAMLDHLPGMFAFALWDDSTRTLFAARDRFGEKPFYFARGPEGELIFGSEIRAILATGLVVTEIDRESLAHVLCRRYVPVDRSIWKQIHSLPPAHALLFRDGELTVTRYWDLPPTTEPVSVPGAIEELRRLFQRSVERQLVADVPIASFLSGGLDSSTVVAIASGIRPGIRTISFGSAGATDLPYAREIAERYQTDHLEIHDHEVDVADLLERTSAIFDEPHADISSLPSYQICSTAAREGAKVILTGEGGDELLAGYRFWYQPLREMERWIHRPALLTAAASIAERTANRLGLSDRMGASRWFRGSRLTSRYGSISEAHRHQFLLFRQDELERLDLKLPPVLLTSETGTVNDALRDDVLDLLPGHWLVRTDRTSMACGVELRSPFLDVDLASFCVSLPSRLKITETEEKWILRRAYEKDWTDAVRRRKKEGFNPRFDRWIRRPELQPLKRRILEDPAHRLWNLLPHKTLREIVGTRSRQIWILLNLGLWAEKWLDSPHPRRC
ncbi:MAG TPA: asparagine synthase (glutamine-hydrolyzing) [Thermoanaerobaculia bacterium]|nr:asparagine synthase (glutamine-hydrolyzing) [Thermoanaerobaculia bacterium]